MSDSHVVRASDSDRPSSARRDPRYNWSPRGNDPIQPGDMMWTRAGFRAPPYRTARGRRIYKTFATLIYLPPVAFVALVISRLLLRDYWWILMSIFGLLLVIRFLKIWLED